MEGRLGKRLPPFTSPKSPNRAWTTNWIQDPNVCGSCYYVYSSKTDDIRILPGTMKRIECTSNIQEVGWDSQLYYALDMLADHTTSLTAILINRIILAKGCREIVLMTFVEQLRFLRPLCIGIQNTWTLFSSSLMMTVVHVDWMHAHSIDVPWINVYARISDCRY